MPMLVRRISKAVRNFGIAAGELDGPSLASFINKGTTQSAAIRDNEHSLSSVPYLPNLAAQHSKVYMETYGCQMNFNDSEIVLSVLKSAGMERTEKLEDADAVFLMTCAIRENAEQKIWNRLSQLKAFKLKEKKEKLSVGLLGCMAERLKGKLLEEDKLVDIVCGPDAYRDLPRLLALSSVESGQAAINVLLSLDETYADISPVRLDANSVSAYVSIMRGCDNMCSYCIVPFTRGRERSRDIESISKECRDLAAKGVKEITLLGQNVNSYRDLSSAPSISEQSNSAEGFKTIYKPKEGGLLFTELISRVAQENPNVRFRFTSPHPKDFPDPLLHAIKRYPNICKQIHLPAQSGSTSVLARMRRGYEREAYLDLVGKIKGLIPDVALSSDFIAGFCSETEEEHKDTVSLMKAVEYDMAYMFAYSMRAKTHAHRTLADDVPEAVKSQRLQEIVDTFYNGVKISTPKKYLNTLQLVLIEGNSKKSDEQWMGRSDGNRTVIIDKNIKIPTNSTILVNEKGVESHIGVGDFVAVEIIDVSGMAVIGKPLYKTTVSEFKQIN